MKCSSLSLFVYVCRYCCVTYSAVCFIICVSTSKSNNDFLYLPTDVFELCGNKQDIFAYLSVLSKSCDIANGLLCNSPLHVSHCVIYSAVFCVPKCCDMLNNIPYHVPILVMTTLCNIPRILLKCLTIKVL